MDMPALLVVVTLGNVTGHYPNGKLSCFRTRMPSYSVKAYFVLQHVWILFGSHLTIGLNWYMRQV